MKNRAFKILFIIVLFALSGCKSSVSTSPPKPTNQQIQNLLVKFGWQESGDAKITWTTHLPKSYKLKPGKIPIGLYWSYHNTLSKNAGLDITPYLGQKVKVQAIPLKKNWKIGPSPESTYAIITTHNSKIIGAWISKGMDGHIVDICESLNHKEFGDLTGQTWGDWVAQQNIVNYSDPFYSKMQKWTPKQLLKAYYMAVNNHQYETAYAMLSTFGQYQIMITNVPVGHLYNTKWEQGGGLSNWKTAKFLGMKSSNFPISKQNNQTAESRLYYHQNIASRIYTVTFNVTLRQETAMSSGRNTYFTTIVRESSNAPWSIAGFSTGP